MDIVFVRMLLFFKSCTQRCAGSNHRLHVGVYWLPARVADIYPSEPDLCPLALNRVHLCIAGGGALARLAYTCPRLSEHNSMQIMRFMHLSFNAFWFRGLLHSSRMRVPGFDYCQCTLSLCCALPRQLGDGQVALILHMVRVVSSQVYRWFAGME